MKVPSSEGTLSLKRELILDPGMEMKETVFCIMISGSISDYYSNPEGKAVCFLHFHPPDGRFY
jgi:hypothetical protein